MRQWGRGVGSWEDHPRCLSQTLLPGSRSLGAFVTPSMGCRVGEGGVLVSGSLHAPRWVLCSTATAGSSRAQCGCVLAVHWQVLGRRALQQRMHRGGRRARSSQHRGRRHLPLRTEHRNSRADNSEGLADAQRPRPRLCRPACIRSCARQGGVHGIGAHSSREIMAVARGVEHLATSSSTEERLRTAHLSSEPRGAESSTSPPFHQFGKPVSRI